MTAFGAALPLSKPLTCRCMPMRQRTSHARLTGAAFWCGQRRSSSGTGGRRVCTTACASRRATAAAGTCSDYGPRHPLGGGLVSTCGACFLNCDLFALCGVRVCSPWHGVRGNAEIPAGQIEAGLAVQMPGVCACGAAVPAWKTAPECLGVLSCIYREISVVHALLLPHANKNLVGIQSPERAATYKQTCCTWHTCVTHF